MGTMKDNTDYLPANHSLQDEVDMLIERHRSIAQELAEGENPIGDAIIANEHIYDGLVMFQSVTPELSFPEDKDKDEPPMSYAWMKELGLVDNGDNYLPANHSLQDELDMLIERHRSIAQELAEGENPIVDAIIANEHIYDGLTILQLAIPEVLSPDAGAKPVPNGLDADRGDGYHDDAPDKDQDDYTVTDKGIIALTLSRIAFFTNSLKSIRKMVKSHKSLGTGTVAVQSHKAKDIILSITDFIVSNDLVLDALTNPQDDKAREFDREVLNDVSNDICTLLDHADNSYVLGYAIDEWFTQMDSNIIGGVSTLSRSVPVLHEITDGPCVGRWIVSWK